MSDWVMLIYVAITIVWGIVGYVKGFDDGRKKQDEDIENIIVKAFKKYNGC